MLEFTATQLDEIEANVFERYKRDLAVYFGQKYSKAASGQDETRLLPVVSRAVAAGRQLGLKTTDSMTRYVALAVLVNEHFAELPEIGRFFDFSGIDPDLKVHILSEALIERLGGA